MTKTTLRGHFKPHRRVQEHGEILNPVTGEMIIPPSMTKQEFQRECDINNIIKHFSVTGMFNHVNANASQGAYSELPDAVDFQDSLHLIKEAETAFLSLPAKVRDRFGQDPSQFLAFMADPENVDEIRKLGLAKPVPPPSEPLDVRVVKEDDPKADPKAS